MGSTSIEWTGGPNGEPGYTFNPWLGCAKVHAGCTHCYAEVSQAVTMRKGGPVRWGEVWQGGQRVVVSDSTWRNPFKWAREAAAAGQRRKVFCASLADVLEVPGDPPSSLADLEPAAARARAARDTLHHARERLWDTIWATAEMCPKCGPLSEAGHDFGCDAPRPAIRPGLDWLLLTKRPENWALVPEHIRPLVWLGTSISDQKTAESHVPRLLEAEGFRYRFLSVEPMVGPVDFDLGRCETHDREFIGTGHPDLGEYCTECSADGWSGELSHGHWLDPVPEQGINWAVFGFESGAQARPGHLEWIRQGVRQCQEAGVAAFVKQLGARPRMNYYEWTRWADEQGWDDAPPVFVDGKPWDLNLGQPPPRAEVEVPLKDHKGRDPDEWPEDLRVREWPNAHGGAAS